MDNEFIDDPADYDFFDMCGDNCISCWAENCDRYRNYINPDYQMIKCKNCNRKNYFNKKEK